MDKRSPNFTTLEVEYLVSAVKKLRHVIECKKSDHTSTEDKLKAWKEIEREFNSKYTHTFRSHKVLKTRYGNLKSVSKQNFAADKRATYATGGGCVKPKTATAIDDSILEICQVGQVLGNESDFDGDMHIDCDFAAQVMEDDCNFAIEVLDEEFGDECCGIECVEETKDVKEKKDVEEAKAWNKYTPKMLRRPTTKSLKVNKISTKNTWVKVAEAKLEKNNLEIELLREKREYLKEKNKHEIEFLKEKNMYEKQKLELEIELLQAQIVRVKMDD